MPASVAWMKPPSWITETCPVALAAMPSPLEWMVPLWITLLVPLVGDSAWIPLELPVVVVMLPVAS